jgi:hypothetical protein
MTAKRLVVAVHKLGISDPHVDLEAAGFDDAGQPIIRKRTRTVHPGELVELPDNAELAALFITGAVREPEEDDLEMLEPRP